VINRRDDPRAGLTEQELVRGWNTGTPRVKIRLATAADVPAVEQLLPAAEVDLTDQMAEAAPATRGHSASTAARLTRPTAS